jgi:hypothetical protein
MSSIDLTVKMGGGYARDTGASYQVRQDLEEVDVTVQRTIEHVDGEIALLIDAGSVNLSLVLDEDDAGPIADRLDAELAEEDRRVER